MNDKMKGLVSVDCSATSIETRKVGVMAGELERLVAAVVGPDDKRIAI